MSRPRWWPLEPARKHYAWGSRTALPEMLREGPASEPLAELWFGAHPDGPATIQGPGGAGETLGDRLEAAGEDRNLPFMAKLIAADAPLSLQVHPGDGARTRRNGCDDVKHEVLIALGEFRLLCGFAPIEAASARLRGAGLDGLAATLTRGGVEAALDALLSHEEAERTAWVRGAAARDPVAALLHAHHPDDAGVVAGLLLNELTLGPGDAVAIPGGTVHAHLGGVGFEAMTASDAVARLGLTRKPIDRPLFLELAVLVPRAPVALRADGAGAYPIAPGSLAIARHRDEAPVHLTGPAVVVCASGIVEIDGVELRAGAGAYLPSGVGPFAICSGRGLAYSVHRNPGDGGSSEP